MIATVVGAGTAVPQLKRSAPCYALRSAECSIVVDLGPGSVWGLLRQVSMGPADIDAVFLTHLHMDHCSDLAPLLFALRASTHSRSKPLMIVGPPGLNEHYEALKVVWGHRVESSGYSLEMIEWNADEYELSDIIVAAAPTDHSITNLAYRFDQREGETGLVFTGDGEPSSELENMCRRKEHILITECALPPDVEAQGHMNPVQAAGLAARCNSKKLILSHLNPGCLPDEVLKAAMAGFDGEVIVAEDGFVVEVG